MLTTRVREITLAPPPGYAFEPGQWVAVGPARDDGAPATVRPFSIASPPRRDGGFELAVARVPGSPITDALHALAPGDRVALSHAQGSFVLGTVRRPVLFVATGTGVAPLRAMLLAAPFDRSLPPFALLLGVRTEADLLYRDDFERLARQGTLRFGAVLAEPAPGWRGRRGLVQEHLATTVRELGGDCDVYACGHGAMVRAVREVARREVSLADDRVRGERYD